MSTPPEQSARRRRVLIAGGGVAALETLLALRALAGKLIEVVVLSPDPHFHYQPMLVAEPFDAGVARTFELSTIAGDLGAALIHDGLDEVDAADHTITTTSGVSHSYDILVVATGARRRKWLDGALTFHGPDDAKELGELLRGPVTTGQVSRIVFAAPPEELWTLPLGELALMTGAWVGERGLAEVELTLVTPEDRLLAAFGTRAADAVRQLFLERGITVLPGTYPEAYDGRELRLIGHGPVRADAVITLGRTEGHHIAGLPHDDRGFIPVDALGRVRGLSAVYAAGDGTNFPLKQGGLAAQQADAVATAVAAEFGAPVEPEPFRPVLRGLLLTGVAPVFLRSDISGTAGDNSEVAYGPLWSPTVKIAGRYLAPYLSDRSLVWHDRELEDRHPRPRVVEDVEPGDDAARELLLALADASAGWADYDEALRALSVVENSRGPLGAEYEAKRQYWGEAESTGQPESS